MIGLLFLMGYMQDIFYIMELMNLIHLIQFIYSFCFILILFLSRLLRKQSRLENMQHPLVGGDG